MRHQYTPFIIETDAHNILSMLDTNNIRYTNILNDCKLLLQQLGRPSLQHDYREENSIADSLAHYGAKQAITNSCILFVEQPPFVAALYNQDLAGTLHRRLVNANNFPFCNSNVLCSNAPHEGALY